MHSLLMLLCIYRVLLRGKKNVHYINELKQQGATWVRKQYFWLFGTATFKDGNQITDRQVVADAQHFFNVLDRHVLTRKLRQILLFRLQQSFVFLVPRLLAELLLFSVVTRLCNILCNCTRKLQLNQWLILYVKKCVS